MPVIESHDGAELHYQTSGIGSVNLILLHGWGGNGSTWSEVLKHLDAKTFRVICLDLRGHGQSSCPTNGCTWENVWRDILAVAHQEEMRQFVPVGFSLGGKLACYLASKFPGRIPAQVLVAPVPPGVVPIDREFGLRVCREAFDWRQNKNVFGNWFGPTAKAELVEAYSKSIAQTPRWILEATAEMALWTSLEADIGRLALPSLMVTGQQDPIYHAEFQKENTLPHLASSTSVTLPSGHFITLECPRGLAQSLSLFVVENFQS